VTIIDMGCTMHLIDLLAKLYKKEFAMVKVAGKTSQWFHVKKEYDNDESCIRNFSTSQRKV